MKRVLSVLLAFTMILGCFPFLNRDAFKVQAEDNPCVISDDMTDEQKDACNDGQG